MRSECPEWTVAGGDPLFIGMQNNGQWSVMWGVVGTDLVIEVIVDRDGEETQPIDFIFWHVEAAESTFNGPFRS